MNEEDFNAKFKELWEQNPNFLGESIYLKTISFKELTGLLEGRERTDFTFLVAILAEILYRMTERTKIEGDIYCPVMLPFIIEEKERILKSFEEKDE